MNDNSDLLPNLAHEDAFEVQLRGYSRRQVDEFISRCRNQIRDLEQRLARALDDGEDLRRDLATTRQQALGAKPAHEEVSERIAQILKLADDEARSQKTKAADDITKLRTDAQQESDKARSEARDQAERMLTAAQEQAERAITSARAEAEKLRHTAKTEADRTTTEARKKADSALAAAKAQAKKALDEATARAAAIHDGAERRLNMLSSRHTETIKRLTDILDGVSTLVANEQARLSLEDEVEQMTAKSIGTAEAAVAAGGPSPAGGTPNGAPRPVAAAGGSPALNPAAGPAQAGPAAGQAANRGPSPVPLSEPRPAVHQAQPRPQAADVLPGAQAAQAAQVAPSRPAAPAGLGAQPVSLQRGVGVTAQDGPVTSRSASIDPDEQIEGVRLMPGNNQ